MGRPHVEFTRVPNVANESFAFGARHPGLRGHVLSRDPVDGAHTALVHAAAQWQWPFAGHFTADLELLVITGDLRVGDTSLAGGAYAFFPAGVWLDAGLSSESGCSVIWMTSGESTFVESSGPGAMFDARRVMEPVEAQSMPWSAPPAFEGRSVDDTIPGLSVKWLREDPQTTAYTLLSRHGPGWVDPRIEAHDTWEELLLLDGDYLMGDTGHVTASTYIFRPGERPHGPQATREGAVWLARGERRIDFQLTSPQWAADRAQRYIDTGPAKPEPRARPFGDWL